MPDDLYHEKYRPQFHFSPQRGFMNDPNGLVYYAGQYHMFFQHTPGSCKPVEKHWGHAVSGDLVHWKELATALSPDELGEIWSGSAVVDWENTSGLATGAEPVLVALYTSCGQAQQQSLAYSNDGGWTWVKHPRNPVLTDGLRDPRVLWHRPTGRWVMALYQNDGIAFYTSANLVDWSYRSHVAGFHECPDLFELAVEDEPGRTRWVLMGADGRYLLGEFDGQAFSAESGKHVLDWGGSFYAGQTWSDIPAADGRTIQIAWGFSGNLWEPCPGNPFNQNMTFPCELSLRRFGEGPRVCREPVREIEQLRRRSWTREDAVVGPGENPFAEVEGELFDWEVELERGDADEIVLTVPGTMIRCRLGDGGIICGERSAPLSSAAGRVRLRILADRTFVEIFGDEGRLSMSCFCAPNVGTTRRGVGMWSVGGRARLIHSAVHELESIWR